ncbi:uncharacterized protein LOC117648508 [Thrips palmi]|uniref:Uncharacterized protein LOC117648508 n=1 Tax=Thrips palmi TaxID=161013 RepID=A0A6P8Z8S0_THRPL|nr:uncharacterized protein LOC117648508 [Thrips palmi]
MNLSFHGDVCDVLLVTPTAISEVTLVFEAKDALLVALILSRQASLGRLKKVSLSVKDDILRTSHRGLRALLLQICQALGLQSMSLSLNVDDEEVLDVIEAKVPVPASLKQLNCRARLEPYLELLMEWHTNTLEDVSLSSDGPRMTSLLAAMPRLRKLTCPMLTDMQLLRQCRSLTYLKLNLTPPSGGGLGKQLFRFLRLTMMMMVIGKVKEFALPQMKLRTPAAVSTQYFLQNGESERESPFS